MLLSWILILIFIFIAKLITNFFSKNVVLFVNFYKIFRTKILLILYENNIKINDTRLSLQYGLFRYLNTLDVYITHYTPCFNKANINYSFLLSHLKGVNCFNLRSKTSKSIIAGGLDGTLKFWNKKTNVFKMLCLIKISNKPVCNIIQLPKAGVILVNHYGKNIILFNLTSLKILKKIQIGKVFTVMKENTCYKDSILTGCSDGSIYDWDVNTGIKFNYR